MYKRQITNCVLKVDDAAVELTYTEVDQVASATVGDSGAIVLTLIANHTLGTDEDSITVVADNAGTAVGDAVNATPTAMNASNTVTVSGITITGAADTHMLWVKHAKGVEKIDPEDA